MNKYNVLIEEIRQKAPVGESFDLLERKLSIGGKDATMFFVDGLVDGGMMQRVIFSLFSLKEPQMQRAQSAEDFIKFNLPFLDTLVVTDVDLAIRHLYSGLVPLFIDGYSRIIIIDCRNYPLRSIDEPSKEKSLRGSKDGFVESMMTNIALIRRRIRDERLTMHHIDMGGASKTDVVVCYMEGIADGKLVNDVTQKLKRARPKSLTLGFQSLAETLIRSGWYNPFPKIRTTERPDTASAQLLEGSVLVICDTSPQVMILPTSIFHYLEQTDDYYFPPLTGSYLRIVRALILIASVVITPLWYLYLEYADRLPTALSFLIPDDPGAIPIIFQLFLVELAIDGLKIASMNTPDMLSSSLSIVGALILGDFAVDVGWLSSDVILYMAFVAIANFAQQNHELGYAFKFMRVMILTLVFFFGIWGFAAGIILFCVFVALNKTVSGRYYLYPLIPFNARAMKKLLIRNKKQDFENR